MIWRGRINVALMASICVGSSAQADEPGTAQTLVGSNTVLGNCNAVGFGNETCVTHFTQIIQQDGPKVLDDIAKGNAATARHIAKGSAATVQQIEDYINARLGALEGKLRERAGWEAERSELQSQLEQYRRELTMWVAKAQALEAAALSGTAVPSVRKLVRKGKLTEAESALLDARGKQAADAVFQVLARTADGTEMRSTGFLAGRPDQVVCVAHAVRAAQEILVEIGPGQLMSAQRVQRSEDSSLALLQLAAPLKATPLRLAARASDIDSVRVFARDSRGKLQISKNRLLGATDSLGSAPFGPELALQDPLAFGTAGSPVLDATGAAIGVVIGSSAIFTAFVHWMAAK